MSLEFDRRLRVVLAAAIERFGTPFHIYDEQGIRENCCNFDRAFAGTPYREYFAVKGLPNPIPLRLLGEHGFGFDCSSLPEVTLARRAGAVGHDVCFTSNNTSVVELAEALWFGALINVDDEHADAQRLRNGRRIIDLVAALRAVGLSCGRPDGGLFAWCAAPGGDGLAFAWQLAEHAGVVVAPGSEYGPDGKGHVRIAAVQHTNDIAERLAPILSDVASTVHRSTKVGRDYLATGDPEALRVVDAALDMLDSGSARVAWVDAGTDDVVVDERARRAILLSFRVFAIHDTTVGPFYQHDRMPLKSSFPGVRVVPGAIARYGSHICPGAVLMPSFVNVGGQVGSGSLVDTWATVGSCAQVGRDVHLSGGVGLGGVLEPAGAKPVVVEDDAFVGSRSIVVEGARVRQGAKLGAGVLLTGTSRVFDAETGRELRRGEAPAWSVCVSATRTRSFPGGDFAVPCLLVIKRLAPGERHDKLLVDSLFREHDSAA
ncbi:MAG: 2,3,4,5-tetrahydropyridine-2,6-dicarboxylate N-succinyltransferase [Sciscionella sp.]